MQLVYRIENKYGNGPYVDFDHSKWTQREHSDNTGYPNPYEEDLVTSRSNITDHGWFCGFKNLNQLQAWFSPLELEKLKSLGFNIVRRKTNETRIGKKQLIFKGLNNEIK